MSLTNPFKVYLASKSPRRQMLLQQIGVDFELIDGEIDESVANNELAINYVRRMSIQKAEAGWRSKQPSELTTANYPVLAADTSIALNSVILGKPLDQEDAYKMLNQLSNKEHEVVTCVSIIYQNVGANDLEHSTKINIVTVDSITKVRFSKMLNKDIEEYLKTNEWVDKAGGYAIQGYAAKYIESINGSYSGVVGLPLFETSQLIQNAFNTK